MKKPILITGIGTDVGKTLIAAIVTEALEADYWKPIQAGFSAGTDAGTVSSLLSNKTSVIHPEIYKLATPASPHIAARKEAVEINMDLVVRRAQQLLSERKNPLVIEGAGGLMVPLTDHLFVADMAKALNATLILVSRNYLGSINHSLLTSSYCRYMGLDVAGWIFSDDYMQYEDEIVQWSGYRSLGSVPKLTTIDPVSVRQQADRFRVSLQQHFSMVS